MSMVWCEDCGRAIDSDMDVDCFVEVPWLNLAEKVWCESCREEQSTAHEAQSAIAERHCALSLAREV